MKEIIFQTLEECVQSIVFSASVPRYRRRDRSTGKIPDYIEVCGSISDLQRDLQEDSYNVGLNFEYAVLPSPNGIALKARFVSPLLKHEHSSGTFNPDTAVTEYLNQVGREVEMKSGGIIWEVKGKQLIVTSRWVRHK